MLKSSLRLLIFFLSGFTLLELSPFFVDSVKGQKLINPLLKKKINDFESHFDHVDDLNKFKESLKEDLINVNNGFINFLAFDNNSNVPFMDIESDIQYQENNIFYAEGNAVIYFFNASLRGDKVKYDKANKQITVEGNLIFSKGKQYFVASKAFFDLEKNTGAVDNIYGVLNIESVNSDFEFISVEQEKKMLKESLPQIEDLKKTNSLSLGLINDFEDKKKFNISSLNLDIPSINVWRYKSDRINFENNILKSKKIIFTNDALNQAQLLLRSNNFTGEMIEDKLKLISRNTWLLLDDKLSIPIGRRTLFDKDPLTRWGFGSDYGEKDGFYLFRGFNSIIISDNFNLKLQPYFLFQRALMGNTNSFRAPKSSILSGKIKNNNIDFSDNFALDANLKGKFNYWKIGLNTTLNSLNPDRLHEAARVKLSLKRTFDLNPESELTLEDKNKLNIQDNNSLDLQDFNLYKSYIDNPITLNEIQKEESFSNLIDLTFYSSFREQVNRGFSGEHEIYFGNGLTVENKKTWKFDSTETNFTTLYDIGEFKAKAKNANMHKSLFRNVIAAKYNYKFPLWERDSLDKSINSNYKYSPVVIKQGIDWITNIQGGIFLYSDESSQKAITFNAGPQIIFGSLKNKFLDYTSFDLKTTYVFGEGESPFAFDNINQSFRMNLKLDQQIYGALVFSYENSYNLNNGKFDKGNYGLEFKRRAYSLGAFYNKTNETLGVKFNIFNFDYSGLSPKF